MSRRLFVFRPGALSSLVTVAAMMGRRGER